MKTETHLKFARKTTDIYLKDLTWFERRMFILGSVEPDINPFSYLKGFSVKPFFGHNWENRKDFILSKAMALENGCLSPFSAGRLIHYICDAFTHTHNITYLGGIYEHSAYEKQLHRHFDKSSFTNPLPYTSGSLQNKLISLHRQYIKLPPCHETDIKFIRLAVHCSLKNGIPHARKQPTMPTNTAIQK